MNPGERAGRRRDVDDALMVALAAGASWREAAEKAGCSRATVQRRMADHAFRACVHAERDRLLAVATGRVVAAMSGAASALAALLASDDEKVRLAASKAILESGTRLHEQTDLAERIGRLEGEHGAH